METNKESPIFKRIIQYLEKSNIIFEVIHHSSAGGVHDYSRTVGTKLEQQAKALFLRVKQIQNKSFAIAALPAQKKADFEQLCRILKAKEIRLGSQEQLVEITGCRYGELPPMGKFFSITLAMDKDLLKEDKIYFNAGSLTDSIIMKPQDLVSLENPILF